MTSPSADPAGHAYDPQAQAHLGVLSRLVIPPLIASGRVSRPLPGATFRDALGLPRPASRYSGPPPVPEGAR